MRRVTLADGLDTLNFGPDVETNSIDGSSSGDDIEGDNGTDSINGIQGNYTIRGRAGVDGAGGGQGVADLDPGLDVVQGCENLRR